MSPNELLSRRAQDRWGTTKAMGSSEYSLVRSFINDLDDHDMADIAGALQELGLWASLVAEEAEELYQEELK